MKIAVIPAMVDTSMPVFSSCVFLQPQIEGINVVNVARVWVLLFELKDGLSVGESPLISPVLIL